MADALFPCHNAFYIGAYQTAINEGADLLGLSEKEALDRDCFVYRSYIALGSYQLVLSEVSDNAPTSLQSIKLMAQYLSNTSESSRKEVMAAYQSLMDDSAVASNPMLLLMAGNAHALEGSWNEALKCCAGSQNLELMALQVQVLLKMDRPDAAEKVLKAMQALDDDATLTQLCNAWVSLGLGGNKIQEAFYVFQELGDKYSWTVKLFNGSAVCCMQMGQFEDAEKSLLEALNKDGKDADTLANLLACGLYNNRRGGQKLRTFLTQLKTVAPAHPYVVKMQQHEDAFAAAAAGYA